MALLRKDLAMGKRVWEAPVSGTDALDGARMDPMGEFVAWTGAGPGGNKVIQWKAVTAPPNQLPAEVRGDYRSVFCDWTEDGTLLGNASRDGTNWMLVIFDRDGNVLRQLETDIKPAAGPIASWRKYGHH